MKRTLKLAILTSAAVFAFGTMVPTYAQDYMRTGSITSQRMVQPAPVPRYTSDYYNAANGEEAYAYLPEAFNFNSCTRQGSYGQGADYSACGGE